MQERQDADMNIVDEIAVRRAAIAAADRLETDIHIAIREIVHKAAGIDRPAGAGIAGPRGRAEDLTGHGAISGSARLELDDWLRADQEPRCIHRATGPAAMAEGIDHGLAVQQTDLLRDPRGDHGVELDMLMAVKRGDTAEIISPDLDDRPGSADSRRADGAAIAVGAA